jgi:uracil-DNA glycosylase
MRSFVSDLARAKIGSTYNQYEVSALLRDRLAAYLLLRASARILLVGEAAGYRGARVSGIPFTSERQLSGRPPAEATATMVHTQSNRRPTRDEVEAGRPFVHRLARGRRVVPIGRMAHAELGGPYIRHPSHGGAGQFRTALVELLG